MATFTPPPPIPDEEEDVVGFVPPPPIPDEEDPIRDYNSSSSNVMSLVKTRDENYARYQELFQLPERTPEAISEMVKSFEAGKKAELDLYGEQEKLKRLQPIVDEIITKQQKEEVASIEGLSKNPDVAPLVPQLLGLRDQRQAMIAEINQTVENPEERNKAIQQVQADYASGFRGSLEAVNKASSDRMARLNQVAGALKVSGEEAQAERERQALAAAKTGVAPMFIPTTIEDARQKRIDDSLADLAPEEREQYKKEARLILDLANGSVKQGIVNNRLEVSPSILFDDEAVNKAVSESQASDIQKEAFQSSLPQLRKAVAEGELPALSQWSEFNDFVKENNLQDATPFEKVSKFKNADRNWFSKAGMQTKIGLAQAHESMVGQIQATIGSGLYAYQQSGLATDPEKVYQLSQAFAAAAGDQQQKVEDLGVLSQAVGGPTYMADIANTGYQMVPVVASSFGVGLAAGGVGMTARLASNVAFATATGAAGLQSYASTYMTATETVKDRLVKESIDFAERQLLDQGVAPEEARKQAELKAMSEDKAREAAMRQAYLPAVVSGLATATITALGGKFGPEAVTKEVVLGLAKNQGYKQAVKGFLRDVAINAGVEIPEEAADQFVQGVTAKLTYEPDKTMGDIMVESLYAGGMGGLFGGAGGVIEYVAKKRSNRLADEKIARDEELKRKQSEIDGALSAAQNASNVAPASADAVAQAANQTQANVNQEAAQKGISVEESGKRPMRIPATFGPFAIREGESEDAYWARIDAAASETPDQRVARLKAEAQAAREITLEEQPPVAGLPPVEPTLPVTPTPEAAVAPVEPVVPAEGARPATPEIEAIEGESELRKFVRENAETIEDFELVDITRGEGDADAKELASSLISERAKQRLKTRIDEGKTALLTQTPEGDVFANSGNDEAFNVKLDLLPEERRALSAANADREFAETTEEVANANAAIQEAVRPAVDRAVSVPAEGAVEPAVTEVAPTRNLADLEVRPPTDNVQQVAAANDLTVGRADVNVPAQELESTVNLSDPKERERVDNLKEQISSEGGFISRVIVDGQNNVVEGQHRVQAMKELGYDQIPAVQLKSAEDFIPDSNALDKVMQDAGLTASDNRTQMRQLIAEIISDEKGDVTQLREYEAPAGFETAWNAATEEVIRQNAAPEAAPAAVEPTPVTPPVTPQLEPLRRVARAEQTEEDVAGLVDGGLVELYKGQPVLTQAGLDALPEAERPRLTPEARKIQIDTRTSEAAAEAISKNLRIGVDQVPVDVRMPEGWTLEGDIYVPPQPTARITPSDIETAVVPEEAGDVFANLVRRKQEVQLTVLQKPVGSQFQNPEEFRAAFDLRGQGHTRFAIRLDLMQEDGAITEDGKNLILATIWDNNTNDEFLSNMEMGSARKNVKSYGYGGRSRQTVEGGRVEQKPLLELIRATRRGGAEADKRTALTLNTFWHEFGHAGYYSLLDAKQKKAINDAYSKTTRAGRRAFFAEGKSDIENAPYFSKYYAKNESEWFAQSFAEYVITQKSDQKKLVPVFEQLLDKIKAVFTKLFNRKEQVNLNDIFDFILRGEAYGQRPTWQGYTMSTKPAVYGTPRGQAISPEFTKRLLAREGVSPQNERRQQIIDGISLKFKRSKNEYGNNQFKTEYDFGGRSPIVDKISFSLEQFDDSTVAVDYLPSKGGKYVRVALIELDQPFRGRAAAERAIKRVIAEIEMDERVGGAEVSPTPEVREARREPAITPQQDRDYLDAVERGDLDAASRMVEDAAKAAGYAARVFHGTPNFIGNVFDVGRRGQNTRARSSLLAFFFSDNQDVAKSYLQNSLSLNDAGLARLQEADMAGERGRADLKRKIEKEVFDDEFMSRPKYWALQQEGQVLDVYVNPENFKRLEPRTYNDVEFAAEILKAKEEGYAGLVFEASLDAGADFTQFQKRSDVYAVFDSNLIKSAEAITRDDQGNIIPPSQRFQPEQADMRYARREQQLANSLDSGDFVSAQALVDGGATMDRATFLRSITPSATQRATTIHTRLERDGIISKDEFANEKGLVYGDGRGAASAYLGAESYEPFPPAGFVPDYSGDRVAGQGAPIDKKFRTILNTFVLNVVDPQTRSFIVKDIANLLENGGRAVFVTRGKDVANSKALVSFGPLERIQRSEGKLTYQKGFTQPELIQYLQETLGDGFEVRALRGGSASDVRVEVVKNTDATLDNPPIVPEARERRRVQMGRAGMETSAVEARLQELGFPTGGIIRVVNEPDADFEGRTIILDGKVTGIELNASALKDNAAIDRVLNHEFAESANADGALNKLVERLTPKEKKEINDTITRLRYEERARTSEEAARAIETLAEAWRGRGFFTRAVARVEAWASKLGFKLTRRAAEYIAARNLADINSGFRTAYNRFINVKGEAREGRAFITPEENARFLELAKDPEANREELQKMVDDAAKKAGFSVFDWWHGTKKDFNTFKATRYDDGLIFFSSKRDFSERWAKNRKPDEKILERIESVKKEARKLVDSLFAADPRFDIKKPWSENTPEMNEAANKYLEAGKEFERSKLDGMTWIEAEREMGVRIIRAYLSADRIFDPSKDWREVLPAILNRLGVKSEAEIDKQSMDMLLKGNYLIWEDKKLTDAVFEKFDAMMIQEDSDGPMNTIAVRDPSLIKMADPVTYDDNGNVIPLEQRFQPTTPDIRYARREVRESRREPEAIPTFTEGTPEAATLKEMEASMAKVDAASEAKGGKPETYKISEIASVWMDSGLGERELQDAIVEYTNLTPANAKRVASAIARQYDIQQSIATAFLETQTGLSVEALPEGVALPKEVDPDRPKPVMQRLFEVFMGVRVPPTKITVNEKTALKDQIRLKAAANRAAKDAQKATAAAVIETIKQMELRGPVRPKQAQALAKRAANVIWTSEKSVEAFTEYAAKVVENTNYDADIREAKAAQKRAKELSKQKTVAMSPQRQVLEDIGKISIGSIDDPRLFADTVNYYLRAFKKVTSPDYVVIPDSEMTSYLSQLENQEIDSNAERERVSNERLAAQYGLPVSQVEALLNSQDIIRDLVAYAKREQIESILNQKIGDIQTALKAYDQTQLRPDQRKLVDSLLAIDAKGLDAKEKQSLVRIGNNVIYNNQTNGAQYFVAVANGQQNARQAAQDFKTIEKNRAWIDLIPTLGSKRVAETMRNWSLELQSVADTFRNIFGKESMAKIFRQMGMYNLDRGFTDAANTLDQIQEKMAEFYKKNSQKYKKAARDQNGILSEGVVGFLIQQVPAKGEAESIAQRRDLIKQDIANRRSSRQADKIEMANRIEEILGKVDGNTVEEILANMKANYRPNYDSLTYLMNDLLPQYKDFLKQFDENFNDQANNYDNPYYLPIAFIRSGPELEITPESESMFYEGMSLRPRQAANTIKRVDYSVLPEDKSGNPKEIQFNLRRGTYDSLSDQINKAYTNEAWQQIFSFMKTADADAIFGGRANKNFMAERLNRLRISRMRRGSANNGAISKFADSISVLARKIGTGIALGGVFQVFKQSPDQLISAIGTTGRYDLLGEHVMTIGSAKKLLDKFSIGRRGDASSGYKYINQMEGAQNRLERAFTESRWSEVKENASKVADVWMVALKKTDFLCAASAWMTYYRANLDKNGIKFEGWDKEAQLVDTDPSRQDAASYAEQMTDIYQGSSDPTKMATFAQSGKSGWENFVKAALVPFNSFAVQQRMRIYSDGRDSFTKAGETGALGRFGLASTIGGLVAFHTMRRLVLPTITGAGVYALYGMLGVDMDEPDDEKKKEEARKTWRQFQGELLANTLVGGAPQFVEAATIDAFNYANYLVSLQLESEDIIDDNGEIMDFAKYQKERSPFWRYQSFKNAPSFGMFDVGFGQAEKVAVQTKQLMDREQMEMYTPEEQRLLYFSTLSEWLYLMRLNDADFARMVGKARRDMIKAVEDREKQIKAIREGR